jgi:hypothetical protein
MISLYTLKMVLETQEREEILQTALVDRLGIPKFWKVYGLGYLELTLLHERDIYHLEYKSQNPLKCVHII